MCCPAWAFITPEPRDTPPHDTHCVRCAFACVPTPHNVASCVHRYTHHTPPPHIQVQLYSTNLKTVLARLSGFNLGYMERISYDSEGTLVLHVGFELGARVYELVGAASDVGVTESSGVEFWSDSECADAHAIPRSLGFYSAMASRDLYPMYKSEPALMIISISISYHDPSDDDITTLYTHLTQYTSASATVAVSSSTCDVVDIKWEGEMPGLVVHYVANHAAPTGSRTLQDYDDYARDLHATYFTESALAPYNGEWYNWDHLMDQHIGLWYSGDEEACSERAANVRAGLSEAGIAVGERGESDAHEMYCGYAGPMTWQYQWQHCDADRSDAPSECACVGSNNNEDYRKVTGGENCKTNSDDDWCSS